MSLEPQRPDARPGNAVPHSVEVEESSGSAPLAKIHGRFIEQGAEFALLRQERYASRPAAARSVGARAWRRRAANEYGSVAQFSELLHRLSLLGAPTDVLSVAARLIRDECRHAELCGRISSVLSGGLADDALRVPRKQLSLYDQQDDPLIAVALSILGACCLGEAVSINGYRGIAAVCDDDAIAAAAEGIAEDERIHATFGWETLSWLWNTRMSRAQHDGVAMRLPAQLAGFEGACGGSRAKASVLAGREFEFSRQPDNMGVLDRDDYLGLFYTSLSTVIFPRLESIGLAATDAWTRRPAL